MFGNLGNLADLMRNAGKIRESVEKATESLGAERPHALIRPERLPSRNPRLGMRLDLATRRGCSRASISVDPSSQSGASPYQFCHTTLRL